jgi:hypothetical protein
VLRDIRLFSLVIVRVFTDVFDNFAKVMFVVTNELGILALFIKEDADFVLFVGKLAFEFGNSTS